MTNQVLKVGNIWYFVYIGIAAAITAVGYFPMRRASGRKKKIYIFALSLLNLAVHFLKLLLPEYQTDYPMSWRKCSFENICAVSVLIYPFVMMTKNDTAKDYIVFLSIIGGAAAVFVPTGAWDYAPFRLESIRFYLSHILLLMQGLYTLAFGIHRPHYKRFWRVPISLFIVLGIITLNEFILRAVGFTEATPNDYIDTTERNSVYIFGPTPQMEGKIGFITALVPEFMKHGFGYRSGDFYWPLVWTFCPLMVYGEVLAHAVGFIWGWKDLSADLKIRKERKLAEEKARIKEAKKESFGKINAARKTRKNIYVKY